MKKTIIVLAYILIASFTSPIFAAGDAEAGQVKTATCMGCMVLQVTAPFLLFLS